MGKNKRGICMAEGGITQETPEQLMARIQAKYGVSGNTQPAPAPAPVAKPQQPPPSSPPPTTLSGVAGIMANRKAQIDKASDYANGGIVKGKGTPTSDDVPVKIKGVDYNLSDTEVVLPSKTRQALGEMLGAEPGNVAQANDLVEKYIEQTNGKPPVTVKEGTNLADGGLLDEEARRMDYQAVTGIAAPSPIPAPVSGPASGGMSLGQSPAPTIYGNGGLPADVVQRGIDTMRSQLVKPQSPAPAATGPAAVQPAAPAAKPVDTSSGPTISDGAGGVYTPEYGSRPGAGILSGIASLPGAIVDVFKDSAQAARGEKSYDQIRAERATGQVTPPTGQSMNAGQAVKVDPFGPTPEKFPAAASSDGAFMTGKNGAAPDSSGGGYTQNGVSYNVNPSNQEGVTKITSSKTNPLYTNIRPEDATAGLKNQMVGGNAADVQQGLDRHARANAIMQSIIDKQPAGGLGILGDGGTEAANAEKTARWRQDDLLQQARNGNRAAGEAIQSNAQLQSEGMRSAVAMRGQDVTSGITARGQDLTAQTEANRLATDSPLKKAQAEGIMAQTDSAKMLADIQKKALAGDPQAVASYRALTGKAPDFKDRYTVVPGGDYIDPENPMQKMRAKPQVLDNATGKMLPAEDQQQGKAQAPAAAIEFLKKNPNQAEAFKAKYGYLPS